MPSTGFPVTQRSSLALVVQAAAYSAGNCVGGTLSFPQVVRRDGGSGILNSVTLRDKGGQAGTYDLFLFDSAPSAQTDKAAVALTAADLAKCIGVVTLAAVKLGASATMGISTLTGANFSFKLASGSTMGAVLVARGTPTYASVSDVSLELYVIPD